MLDLAVFLVMVIQRSWQGQGHISEMTSILMKGRCTDISNFRTRKLLLHKSFALQFEHFENILCKWLSKKGVKCASDIHFLITDTFIYNFFLSLNILLIGGIGVLPSRDSCLLNKALDKKSVLECKRTTGKCKCGCNCISLISARDIYNMRERFWTKSRHSQSQYLIHTMALKTVAGRYTFLTLDNGLKVCKKAFGSILKIDKKRFTSTKKLNGKDAKAAADKMPRSVTSTTISALAWLQTYAQERGDRMPHSTDVLLPYKTTKVAVYNTYRLDCGNRPCGRSQFFQLWKDHFPHLKIKEVRVEHIVYFAGCFLTKLKMSHYWKLDLDCEACMAKTARKCIKICSI